MFVGSAERLKEQLTVVEQPEGSWSVMSPILLGRRFLDKLLSYWPYKWGLTNCCIPAAQCTAKFKDLEGCTTAALEACGTDYVIYANSTRIAEGGEEFRQQCSLFLEQVSCMDKFCSRCLEGIIRAVTLLGLRSSYEFTEEMCTDDSPVNRDYFNAVKCLNKAGAKIREQLVRIRLRLYTIVERAPGRKKIQYACCTYHNNIREITNAIDGVCPDGAGSKFYMSVMDRSFGDLLSIACGGHTQGSAECHALGPITPLETLKPEDAPSFVGPMLAIASSLAET